jgi:hypothetical protein
VELLAGSVSTLKHHSPAFAAEHVCIAASAASVKETVEALEHLECAFEFLAVTDPVAAGSAATAIQSAVASLAPHPLIGRRIYGEIRELDYPE